METNAVRCAVLLSGSGRTLENFLVKRESGELPLEIVAVVSSRPRVRGVEIAKAAGLPVGVFPRRKFKDVNDHNRAINDWLAPFRPEIIALAGYLCFYQTPAWFSGPVVNIHPALLPRFGGQGYYGERVHQAVLEAGDRVSGCTVHLVDESYDTGKILEQLEVAVLPDDDVTSLAGRVFEAECRLYPRVLARLARRLKGK